MDHSGHQGMDMSMPMPMGKKTEESGYSKHAGHSLDEFKKKFYVSMFLTLPVLILSPAIQGFLRVSLKFSGDTFILFLFSSVVFFYGGLPFLRGAVNELRHRLPGMMVLLSLAILVAYIYSSAVVLGLRGEVFFWELATLIDIMLLGHWLEMRSVMGASHALEKLSALIPDVAHLILGGKETQVNSKDLKDGDIIVVKPGEKIPSDGVVMSGESAVNESMLTGESKPADKKINDKVIGGSINEDGVLQIKVKGVGESSYLSKVINLVKLAQASKSKTQVIADKAALWLTIIAITAGIVTFVAWLLVSGDIAFAIERAATVLIIACPHALGLAVPLVVSISTTLSAQNGLLIKNRIAFEDSRKISAIIFDKTGTLTKGQPEVTEIIPNPSFTYPNEKILKIAARAAISSNHPLSQAVVKAAEKEKMEIKKFDNFKEIAGKGVTAKCDEHGEVIALGNIKILEFIGVEAAWAKKALAESKFGTLLFVVHHGEVMGAILLADEVKAEAKNCVANLKKIGIDVWMLTGDNAATAKVIAEQVGITNVLSEVLPENKASEVQKLQEKGMVVAMVGDGINDAPALAQADVGIAIGSGTDVAAETADVILVNSNLNDITNLIMFGRATYGKMVQNLWWATGYNVIAIPLAAGVLFNYGIMLSPALGAVFMSLSTIIVAINAKTLRIKR